MIADNTVRRALDMHRLKLPPSPPILAIEAEEYVDSSGDDSLRVWVVLPDEFDEETITGDEVLDIKSTIHQSLLSHGIDRFPYIFFIKLGEHEDQHESE
jgi:hypothetical protein